MCQKDRVGNVKKIDWAKDIRAGSPPYGRELKESGTVRIRVVRCEVKIPMSRCSQEVWHGGEIDTIWHHGKSVWHGGENFVLL